jgi:chemotaxis protein MotA
VTTRSRRRVDLTSLLALPLAIGVVLVAQLLEGGSGRSLWQPTAFLVVIGGTAAAVLVSFPIHTVRLTLGAMGGAFTKDPDDLESAIRRIVAFSIESRRRGILALEPEIEYTSDPFLRNALTLAVDGADSKTIRQILEIENAALCGTAEGPSEVLETAAGYTPTLGILGAVLGLIHVMESLNEPAKLGAGIAVAFVATVYGVGAANLVLLPIASRLRARSRAAALRREVIVEGMVALQEGLNPRVIEQKLRSYMPTAPTGVVSRRRPERLAS